ncbi:hypothetical protein NE237_032426 [Protea cynaroides]|uniref:Uncharacterized protein n=1 Tax=Protea cynaroides TaxID=273540 RepID=A0A9Q0L3B7_9MAGN|nr:hypothetical protein NE237_032426 [Protea cynaroides]
MKGLAWNIRGLNCHAKQQADKHLIHKHRVDFCVLLEIKVSISNDNMTSNHIVPNWNHIHNGDDENPNRIWIGWNQMKVSLEVISVSKYLIHSKITIKIAKKPFLWTAVYGANSREMKMDLWREIDDIQNPTQLPWVKEFNNYLDRNYLTDLSWKDQLLTWSSGRKEN